MRQFCHHWLVLFRRSNTSNTQHCRNGEKAASSHSVEVCICNVVIDKLRVLFIIRFPVTTRAF